MLSGHVSQRWCTQLNMLVFSICIYGTHLAKLKDWLSEVNSTFLLFSVTACSFGVLVYDACKTYRTNGCWMICNFCVIGLFILFMMETTRACSPGLHMSMKVAISYGGMLTMKLSFDLAQKVFGMNIE